MTAAPPTGPAQPNSPGLKATNQAAPESPVSPAPSAAPRVPRSRLQRKPRIRTTAGYEVGPGGLLFLVITTLILGTALYTQANLLFWAFGLMMGALAVSLVVSWQMLAGISVTRIISGHGVVGEPAVLRYRVRNRKSWMPLFGLVISENWGHSWKESGPVADKPQRLKGRPFGWVLHVGPNQTVQSEALCWPSRRGAMKFERVAVWTSFPFGIVQRVVEFEQPGTMLVYPQLYRINRRLLFSLATSDPTGRKQIERPGGSEEFYGTREYREGDSLKMIDWKRSARSRTLVTRELNQPSPPRMMIALDLRKDTLQRPAVPLKPQKWWEKLLGIKPKPDNVEQQISLEIERAISLVTSLVCDAHYQGYRVGMAVLGVPCVPFPVYHSLPHRTKLLEALATIDVTLSTKESQALPAKPNVIVKPGKGADQVMQGANTTTILMAGNMDQYVAEFDDSAFEMLNGRAAPQTRRQVIEEAKKQ